MNSLKKLAREYLGSFSQEEIDEFYNDLIRDTKKYVQYIKYTQTDADIDIRTYEDYKQFLKDNDLDESYFDGIF